MTMSPEQTRAGWIFAMKFVVTPSVLVGGAVWYFTHDPLLSYVMFFVAWLFALVGAAVSQPPGQS